MAEVTYNREDRIAQIHMNAPDRGNAFTPSMRREMNQALLQYKSDDEAWIAIISTEGPDFCIGSADPIPHSYKDLRERANLWGGGYVEIWKPIIGALRGQVNGEGLALALGCDLRVADDSTRLSAGSPAKPEDPNVTAAWLIALVGQSLALEMLWLGKTMDDIEAQSRGLVNRIIRKGEAPQLAPHDTRAPMNPASKILTVPDGDPTAGAFAFAEELLQWAPMTRNFQKEIALRSVGLPFFYIESLEHGNNPYASEDSVEGARAFSESRFPIWKNR